jgi:ribonuclease HI
MMKTFRIYCDGGARGNPGPAASGAVLVDPETEELIGSAAEYLSTATNNQAEYHAVVLGLRKAKELGAGEVEVVMDSELAVRQLNGEYRVKNEELAKKYLEVHNLAQNFKRISFRHVTRDKNTRADELVNKVLDEHKIVL